MSSGVTPGGGSADGALGRADGRSSPGRRWASSRWEGLWHSWKGWLLVAGPWGAKTD